jgi:hypothetical protein
MSNAQLPVSFSMPKGIRWLLMDNFTSMGHSTKKKCQIYDNLTLFK